MSHEATAWAFKQKPQNSTQKLVLMVLADCHNAESGRCYPSHAYIGKHAICSERTAIRATEELATQGYINIIKRNGVSNRYKLNFNYKPLTNCHPCQIVTTDKLSSDHCQNVTATTDKLSPEPGNKPWKEPLSQRSEKGSRLSQDWKLPEEYFSFAIHHNISWSTEKILSIADDFKDYWVSKAGAGGVKLDWFATWRRWIRNQRENYGNTTSQQNTPRLSTVERNAAAAREYRQKLEGQRFSESGCGDVVGAIGGDFRGNVSEPVRTDW